MLSRFLMMFAVVFVLGACSTTDDEATVTDQGAAQGVAGQEGPLSDVYGENGANTPGSQADLAATAGDRVFFGYDRYDLTPEARTILEAQAEWLKKYPNLNISIEGHCDERGTREYNLALGERRAQSVKSYLIAYGVDASRVQTISYGKERPSITGADEASWAQNRRGVTTVE